MNGFWLGQCQAFILCPNEATTIIEHEIVGELPICQRCKDKLNRLEASRTKIGVPSQTGNNVADR